MDELLEQRYRTLFRIYGAGDSGLLLRAKNRIYHEFEETGVLRADAALFLLVNVDHMLLRPYAGYVPALDGRPVEPPALFKDYEIVEPLDKTLEIIFRNLQGERPYSAHDVAGAVETSWRELAQIFLWG